MVQLLLKLARTRSRRNKP